MIRFGDVWEATRAYLGMRTQREGRHVRRPSSDPAWRDHQPNGYLGAAVCGDRQLPPALPAEVDDAIN